MRPDLAKWEKEIKDPLWYQLIVPDLREVMSAQESGSKEREEVKELIYGFFEEKLLQDSISLGSRGKEWDQERKPIDTIVIHHTSNPAGMRPSRLSAIELVRLYAPYFADPTQEGDKVVAGQPIYSGHFRNGAQVFYPYHWFIREDGTAERLLFDEEIGWHAGNWEVNCRSIAICFDGDFETSKPSEEQFASAAKIIREQYPSVGGNKVLGHGEINKKTTCPSKLFLTTDSQSGWKEDLLSGI